MKADIHPDYVDATVTCSCGNTFKTRSTVADIHVELCNECHPFYTGKQKLVDSGGRVERFQRRYGKKTFTRGDGEQPAAADQQAPDDPAAEEPAADDPAADEPAAEAAEAADESVAATADA